MVSHLKNPETLKVSRTVSFYIVAPLEVVRYDMFNVMVYLHERWYIASSITVDKDVITLRPCRCTTGFLKDIVKAMYLTVVSIFTLILLYKLIILL